MYSKNVKLSYHRIRTTGCTSSSTNKRKYEFLEEN